MSSPESNAPLLWTPLHRLHLQCGARMVSFAGYEMPLQFAEGIIKEHRHTRRAAGLFDVSHMGQILLRARSGRVDDVARALERLAPIDLIGLREGGQRYTVFTNAEGGILDDVMVARRSDHLALVVNASRKGTDFAHLQRHLSAECDVVMLTSHALLALQGPAAEAVLSSLAPEVAAMRFMDVQTVTLLGHGCEVSRSGYSGEDGFEIRVPADTAETLALRLLEHSSVALAGLGARDTLRLEAGLCLYGSDLDETITPVEAALEWSIQKSRRANGERAGGFPGAAIILRQLADGIRRRRVGLRPHGRTPVRAGAQLYSTEQSDTPVGFVSSGGFGPTVEAPVAMGYVDTRIAGPGTRLFADVRGKRLALSITALPFVPARYKRR